MRHKCVCLAKTLKVDKRYVLYRNQNTAVFIALGQTLSIGLNQATTPFRYVLLMRRWQPQHTIIV